MSWKATAYVTVVVLGGLATVAELPTYWKCADPLRFAVFVALAILTSFWKISLPGVRGTMSVNFLLVLVGCTQLSAGETLAMALIAVIAQYFYRIKATGSVRLVQAAFNLCSVAIAVRGTTIAYLIILPTFPALELPFRLAMTATLYFVLNTMPVAIIISLTENRKLVDTWKECFFWSFPYYMVGAAISGLLWEVRSTAAWQAAIIIGPITYVIYRSYHLYLSRLEAEKKQVEVERNHSDEVANLHLRTIEVLALAIEAKDQTTHDHLQRVQVYCKAIGQELGISELETQALRAAALLHDIGKLAVPEHIISKPGKLTPEEFEKMKIHPIVGGEILERVRFPYPVVPIVRHHHEKWDGSGYPDGLRGEQIPLGARILSAVDCFDALSSDRQYRPALPRSEALAYLRKESGRSFDPRIVDLISNRYLEFEEMVRTKDAEENVRLSTDIKVERGEAPAAGFAGESGSGHPERAEFVESIAAAHAESQFLLTVSQDLTVSIDSEAMFTKLAETMAKTVPYDTMAYYHIEGGMLSPMFVSGKEKDLYGSLSIPRGQGLSGWVADERKTILNGNPAVEPASAKDRYLITQHRSAISAPVEGARGVIGVLTLYSSDRDRYSRDHLRMLMLVAGRLAFVVENALRFQKASGDAFTDELTGLPNSRAYLSLVSKACEAAKKGGDPLSVVVMDLDGFKSLNDTLGHLEGNNALREIARHGQPVMPAGGTLARIGGDEFVAILPGFTGAEAAPVAERLQRVIEQVGAGLAINVGLSCSWGVGVLGADGAAAEELVAAADRRMYEHKRSKRACMEGNLARLAASIEVPPVETISGAVLSGR